MSSSRRQSNSYLHHDSGEHMPNLKTLYRVTDALAAAGGGAIVLIDE
jgi:hypothetical protein